MNRQVYVLKFPIAIMRILLNYCRKGFSQMVATIGWIVLGLLLVALIAAFVTGKFDDIGNLVSRALLIPGGNG